VRLLCSTNKQSLLVRDLVGFTCILGTDVNHTGEELNTNTRIQTMPSCKLATYQTVPSYEGEAPEAILQHPDDLNVATDEHLHLQTIGN